MNELQVRLSADISALQSALKKAKQALKDFNQTSEDPKGGVGFKRKIGLIEQLTNKAKALRVSLSQATNEKQVEQYNQALEQTGNELTRLNALGRSVSTNLGSVGGGFTKVANSGGAANSVAIEFNRVIQDSPFGLIGIGNNLQQLAGNFANVSNSAGGTGAAIKASLGALVSPVNLALLAVSALTAGFTAYQMGSLDFIFGTEDVGKASEKAANELEDYRNSLDAVTRANIEGASQAQTEIQSFKLLKAQIENANVPLKDKLEAVKELKNQYPEYLSGLTDEQILAGNVGDAYENLTKQIIASAKARAFSDSIAENSEKIFLLEEKQLERTTQILKAREDFTKAGKSIYDVGEIEIIKQINDLSQEQIDDVNEVNRLKKESERLESEINNQIKEGARFTENKKEAVNEVNSSLESQEERLGLISGLTAQISDLNKQRELSTSQEEINLLTGKINLLKEELNLINAIAKRANTPVDLGITATLPARDGNVGVTNPALEGGIIIPEDVQTSVTDNLKEQKSLVDELSGAYAGLGSLIGKAFDNAPFGQFLGTFIAFAAKMVAANFKIAASNAISGASNAALATGPAAPISLPAFIAGSLGVVAAAFAAIGGGGKSASVGGGGGGSMGSGRAPQIFTNAQAPSVPNSSSPTPSGSIDFDRAQGRLSATVTGEDISFVYDRFQERKNGGG